MTICNYNCLLIVPKCCWMFVHDGSYKAVNSRDMSPRQQRSRVDRVTISGKIREQAIERGSRYIIAKMTPMTACGSSCHSLLPGQTWYIQIFRFVILRDSLASNSYPSTRDGINKLARANAIFFHNFWKSTKSCFRTNGYFSKNASRMVRKNSMLEK